MGLTICNELWHLFRISCTIRNRILLFFFIDFLFSLGRYTSSGSSCVKQRNYATSKRIVRTDFKLSSFQVYGSSYRYSLLLWYIALLLIHVINSRFSLIYSNIGNKWKKTKCFMANLKRRKGCDIVTVLVILLANQCSNMTIHKKYWGDWKSGSRNQNVACRGGQRKSNWLELINVIFCLRPHASIYIHVASFLL